MRRLLSRDVLVRALELGWSLHTIWKCHDPAVDLSFLFHFPDVVCGEILIGNVTLLIAFEILACKLSR